MIPNNDMIRFIIELLKQNNRVIVPNFGAFIISQGTNDKVLFNNFLSFNDGLLIGHLCQEKGIPKSDALIEVNNFVETIRGAIDSKGKYTLQGLGSFTKDSHNVLRFSQDEGLRLVQVSETIPTSTTAAKDLLDIDATQSAHLVIDEKPTNETQVPLEKNGKLLTIDSTEPAGSDFPPTGGIPDNQPAADHKEDILKTRIVAQTASRPTNPRYYKAPKASKTDNTKPEKKKKSLAIFVLIFILIPVLFLVLYVGVYQDRFNLFNSNKPIAVEQPVKQPTVPVEAAPEPVKEDAKAFKTDKRYHIIAATFKSLTDAQAYADKLKGKGFTNALVIPRSGLFLVSIDAGNNLVETEARQEEIVNTYLIENYILTVK